MKRVNALLLKAQKLITNDNAQILAFIDENEGIYTASISVVGVKGCAEHETKAFNSKQAAEAYISETAQRYNIRDERAKAIFIEYGLQD